MDELTDATPLLLPYDARARDAEADRGRLGKDTDERVTPPEIFQPLHELLTFVWDVAALASNCRVVDDGTPCYFGPDHAQPEFRNALTIDWFAVLYRYWQRTGHATVWCNPPYSRGMIDAFCAKALEQAARGVTTYMLLPSDVSTGWYRTYIYQREHYIYEGRGKFKGAPLDGSGKLASAKFGSILRVFRPALPKVWLPAYTRWEPDAISAI